MSSDAIDLWACYAHGYLSGRFLAGGSTKYTTIVRHEDLVPYPTKIIDALIGKTLKRKRLGEGFPVVAPIDSYVGGHKGSKSSRGKALLTINRGRYTEPSELRQWVVQQTQRRSTLIGLLRYIPYAYAFTHNRPMVWFFCDTDPLKDPVDTPPPPPARGRYATASGGGSASGSYAPARGPNIVEWLQSSGP